jgi:hypothetical protein
MVTTMGKPSPVTTTEARRWIAGFEHTAMGLMYFG